MPLSNQSKVDVKCYQDPCPKYMDEFRKPRTVFKYYRDDLKKCIEIYRCASSNNKNEGYFFVRAGG